MQQITLSKSTLELFLTDLHFPTEDPQVWSLITQVAKAIKPSLVWLNGDTMDFDSVSSFMTKPEARLNLAKDLKHGRKRLEQLREICPNANMYYKMGNHDVRLQKFLYSKAPELSGLEELELNSLLHLKDSDITFVPEDEKVMIGELWHLHGHEVPTGNIYPARAMLARANANVIFGHRHKFSVAYQNDLSGKVHVAWSIGCGQRLNVDYDLNVQWQQGWALVEYTREGFFHINPVEVFNLGPKKACMVYGKLYIA